LDKIHESIRNHKSSSLQKVINMVDIPLNTIKKPQGGIRDYLSIARFDHSTKHIFIIPGIVLAYLLRGLQTDHFTGALVFGFLAALCIASANYVINEWLDREFDLYHPVKSERTAVQKDLRGSIILIEWLIFVTIGLGCAYAVSNATFIVGCVFGLQGLVYNVKPMRTKDKAYLDVISESINNPLRLMIGWSMVDPATLPPSSIILAYWLGGAFLMTAKRLSEHREIVASYGRELLVRYRASFSGYTEASLTISCFVYGLLSSFFLAVFLIKYRIEYILLMPLIIWLFAHYFSLSLQAGVSVQHPEKLFREKWLVFIVILLAVLFVLTTLVNIPMLTVLTDQRYIRI
jgi:4-hydroxybenzoate polyprenyltransferase